MKNSLQKALVLMIGIFITLTAGCEEQKLPGTKMSRLIATENRQLKTQLAQCNKEIEKQKALVEKCNEAKKVLRARASENIAAQIDPILDVLIGQNQELNAQIKRLKKELEEFKGTTDPQNP